MIWTCGMNVLILTALTLCTDFVSTSSKECSIEEEKGLYYSTRASNSSGKLLKTFEDKNKEECENSCCELEQCNFMMFSTVLRDHEKSTNITCFLFNCAEILKCKTKTLPQNITGVSFIGIKKQENFTETNLGSNYSNSTIEEHNVYKLPSNSTIHTLEIHSPINTIMQNTDNFNKINNSDVFGLHNTTKVLVPSKAMHSPINHTYVPSDPLASNSNNSYPTISMSKPWMSIGNNSHSALSMIIPSQSMKIWMNSNHSLSTPSHPLTSIHNTNRSTLATSIHSTPIHTHTLGNRQRSNNSLSHVGQLSGSHLNANSGSNSPRYQNHTFDKISYTLSSMSMSADPLVNLLKSNPDSEIATSLPSTFVYPHYKYEALALSTMSSLDAVNRNISQLHSSSSLLNKVSKSSLPTSHTSKGDSKIRKKFSEQQSHTTRVSLVISLIFGILFFGTVVFLIGRRWSEQCFRRGYSRVDYLLNDYD